MFCAKQISRREQAGARMSAFALVFAILACIICSLIVRRHWAAVPIARVEKG